MSNLKKTFIGYKDRIDYTEEMSLEEMGKLFNAILCYQNGKEIGELGNLKFVWSKIKKEFETDTEKRDRTLEQKSEAGKRHKGNQYTKGDNNWKAQKKVVEQMEQNGTNGTVSVSDSVSDSVLKEIGDNKLSHKESEGESELDIALNDLIEARKKLKKPMTERAIKLVKNKLEKMYPGDTEMQIISINQSIERGWQSVFEVKEQDLKYYRNQPKKKRTIELHFT